MSKSAWVWLILLLATLGSLSTACLGLPAYEYKGVRLDPPAPIPNFELNDVNRQPFHLTEVKGDIALVYFGYTYCPDVCPLTLATVKQALNGLNGKERVHVIFISVDPERDTPEVLGKYMAAFGPEFKGLTDNFTKIQAVMEPFGAFAEKEAAPNSAAGYLMNHTARLYLLDPQGQLLLTYPHGFTAEELRSDLDYLLKQGES